MDIVFMDTETLGLDPDAPIWEFAAIRRFAGEVRAPQHLHFMIKHDPTGWLDDFPEEFLRDYQGRYDDTFALREAAAARAIADITCDAHVIGAVPNFDTERLAKLLQRNGVEPEWHYHLIDVENLIVGYLAGKPVEGDCSQCHARRVETLALPWNSDKLSMCVGVDPTQFARHTAMGDALWVQAQYDAVMGGVA